MSTFGDARADLTEALQRAGVPTFADPATVNPPCALVGPCVRVRVDDTGLCLLAAEFVVWLMHPAPAGEQAITWLGDHLGAVVTALMAEGTAVTADLGSYEDTSGALPAYQCSVTLTLGE